MTFDKWYFSKVGVTVEVARERGVFDLDLMAQCWEAAVKQARIDALEEAQADLIQALIDDCENGVKFLNEKAAEDFKKNFPHLRATIKSLKGTPCAKTNTRACRTASCSTPLESPASDTCA